MKMNLTFDMLLPKLAEYSIEIYRSKESSLLFNDLSFLGEDIMDLKIAFST